MSFAAERCTADEVVILRCVSVSLIVVVNEGQCKGILDEEDEQTSEETSEERNAFLADRFESFDSSALPGAQSHHHVSKIGVLKHAIPTGQEIQIRQR